MTGHDGCTLSRSLIGHRFHIGADCQSNWFHRQNRSQKNGLASVLTRPTLASRHHAGRPISQLIARVDQPLVSVVPMCGSALTGPWVQTVFFLGGRGGVRRIR